MSYHHQKETPSKSKTISNVAIAYKCYDFFYTSPDTVESLTCKVCGITCDEDRGIVGPTGHLSAMSGNHTLHDLFRCPNTGKGWHNEAVQLAIEIDSTPSCSVKQLIIKDLNKVLQQGELS